jgi:hypothetical protein
LLQHINVLQGGMKSIKIFDFVFQTLENCYWIVYVEISLLAIEWADVDDFMFSEALKKIAVQGVTRAWRDEYRYSILINFI